MEIVQGAICTPEEFADNLKLDFSAIMRKKGSIDYLPWAEIVRALHQKVPGCTYGFREADENGGIIFYTPDRNAYLRPYLIRHASGHIVMSPPGFFPISNMAARHKAMVDPDIRAIDNCLRRAIAKEIGVHTGIGLQLWASQDPYDEVEDEAVSFNGSAKTIPPAIVRGGVTSSGAAALTKAAAEPEVGTLAKLNQAAKAAGLDEWGKATVAKAARVESWEKLRSDQAPKIIQLLGDADHVKMFNAGKNTKGQAINPKSKEDEIIELVQAFGKAPVTPEVVVTPAS